MIQSKYCKPCNTTKPLCDFHNHKGHKDGLSSNCKTCVLAKNALWQKYNKKNHLKSTNKWRERNKAKIKGYKLKSQFGITSNDYQIMLENQNHCCFICDTHQNDLKKSLAVDHCHTTGKIRGLLCGECNRGIGFLKDDIHILQKAINYLKKDKDEKSK